jgi:hypothetical protein
LRTFLLFITKCEAAENDQYVCITFGKSERNVKQLKMTNMFVSRSVSQHEMWSSWKWPICLYHVRYVRTKCETVKIDQYICITFGKWHFVFITHYYRLFPFRASLARASNHSGTPEFISVFGGFVLFNLCVMCSVL